MECVNTTLVRRVADNRHECIKSINAQIAFAIGPDVVDMREDGLTIRIRREDAEHRRHKKPEFNQVSVLENNKPLVVLCRVLFYDFLL